MCARGRRPARSPSALRAFGSARRLEARPGPATAHRHRSLARRFLGASWGSRVLSFWGARVRVVTNVVNPRCFSCGFLPRCYERRQSEGFFAENGGFGLRLTMFVTGVLAGRLESRWFDDVCNIGRPLVPRPGPAPRSVPYPQFRMQFPDTCSSSLSEKPGISTITFQSMKCTWGNCMRICADRFPPPPMGGAAWPC